MLLQMVEEQLSNHFVTVYNRMWKNGANTAMDIKTFGNSKSGVNSDVLIRIDSRGDPTPSVNVGPGMIT
jgi:hypothetical protein